MFSIVIPAFNESENLEDLINELQLNLKKYNKYEIIIINDCSTDNTNEIINNISKIYNIKIITNSENKGQSYSIHKGVQSAKYPIIITIDADGQNNPKDIPKLLKTYLSNDDISLIGGIRKKRNDSKIKIASSKIANLVRSKFLNDECKDTGCSLKIFNKDIFLGFEYFNGMHRFLPALFKGYGCKMLFLDVDHRKRKHGYSKYGTFDRLIKGIKDMIRVRRMLKDLKIK